eukprot:984418-Pleurochrysis_carterae.AAC.1
MAMPEGAEAHDFFSTGARGALTQIVRAVRGAKRAAKQPRELTTSVQPTPVGWATITEHMWQRCGALTLFRMRGSGH